MQPVSGDVRLGRCELGDIKYLQARLIEGEKDCLPPLHMATITRVTRNGMVIQGMELVQRVSGSSKGSQNKCQQTWWVLVIVEQAPAGIDVLEDMAHGDFILDIHPSNTHSASFPAWRRAMGHGDRDPGKS